MSKDYSSDIRYKIHFQNTPSDQIITDIYDSVIYVQIDSRGFDLLNQVYLKKSRTINIDLTNIRIHNKRYSAGNYVLSESILGQIRNQSEFSNQINRISPDTLFLKVQNTVSKEVEVKLNMDIIPRKQHYVYGDISQSIKTVMVNGPFSIIDTIKFITSEYIKLEDVQEDQNFDLPLVNPFKKEQVKFSIDTVKVSIQIQEYTESTANIPITIINNSKARIKLFPESVNVRYLVALKDFERITKDMFSAVINFNSNSLSNQQVKLDHYPPLVKIIDYEPKSVEYLILINNE